MVNDKMVETCSRECRRTGGFKERKSWPVEELLKEMF